MKAWENCPQCREDRENGISTGIILSDVCPPSCPEVFPRGCKDCPHHSQSVPCPTCLAHWRAVDEARVEGYRRGVEDSAKVGESEWVFDGPGWSDAVSKSMNYMAGWQGATVEYHQRILALLPTEQPTTERKEDTK